MKISELPEPLKSKALEYKTKDTDYLIDAFEWSDTKEEKLWELLYENTKITPEIVKEYYKNAKEVRCLYNDVVYDITKFNEYIDRGDNILLGAEGFSTVFDEDVDKYACIYDKEFNKLAEIVSYKEKPSTNGTQPHYDNTHGSLYKIAEQRGWNSYQFDIVKRIDRALKKGQFDEDLKKTKYLIDLWSKEVNND